MQNSVIQYSQNISLSLIDNVYQNNCFVSDGLLNNVPTELSDIGKLSV